ncbi:terminase large subunit [Allokutzneria sp. A3M-2-11 16]|uniref:terminase large subunit n=1 Tax=Allokutzneria sp. A3M-2-11 16 TaxID=2962043 RepID=UPI0020B81053|nr:terminase TerL endonuclease subunit [Allokutzneria sp. A3M-2-11 16]
MCDERGDHFCLPRAEHARLFAEELCCHTKDRWARTPFVLSTWQREDIVYPLFGRVVWSTEWQGYIRRYRIAWIEVARKNGKSELLAFAALYLLVGDGVEGAEIYGAAKDKEQAAKVFDVARRMVQLSPILSKRLIIKDHIKRIIDPKTGSYYEVIAADASGNLGHNPSGVIFDEVLTQPDGRLWDALRTGMGTRAEPLMIAATTAGDSASAFARTEHDEFVRIAEDPDRAPHRFAYVRALPQDADPFDEELWHLANPALGDFLSIQSLREEALEAKNDPSKENSWRQYRCNQWVQQAHRWMPMHLYQRCTGTTGHTPGQLRELHRGRTAWAGLDLASKLDLTAWCTVIPDGIDGVPSLLWRFWLPEAGLAFLDERTEGKFSRWAEQGWLHVTEGDVIDYERVYSDLAEDAALLRIVDVSYDEWSGEPVRAQVQKTIGAPLYPVAQTYRGMTPGMTEIMARTKAASWSHHRNPVAAYCFDSVEVIHPAGDPDLLRPAKPERNKTAVRIDAVPTAAMALLGWSLRGTKPKKSRGMLVMG